MHKSDARIALAAISPLRSLFHMMILPNVKPVTFLLPCYGRPAEGLTPQTQKIGKSWRVTGKDANRVLTIRPDTARIFGERRIFGKVRVLLLF